MDLQVLGAKVGAGFFEDELPEEGAQEEFEALGEFEPVDSGLRQLGLRPYDLPKQVVRFKVFPLF